MRPTKLATSAGRLWRAGNARPAVAELVMTRSDKGDQVSPQCSGWIFSYKGLHAEALQHRSDWFLEPAWPRYVAWWADDDYLPDWSEAAERYQYLYEHGPTTFAFTFKQPFDADGRPLTQRDVTTPVQTAGAVP
jgi:hypothetical protein